MKQYYTYLKEPIMSPEAHILESKLNDAGESTSDSIEDTLAQRGDRYGSFQSHSEISQRLSSIMKTRHLPEFYMTEAAEMICHKLARIANGDPYYDDSWRDIAGYAQLVVDILNGKHT
jgi:hypothetical protein